jgi:hypothetical protein
MQPLVVQGEDQLVRSCVSRNTESQLASELQVEASSSGVSAQQRHSLEWIIFFCFYVHSGSRGRARADELAKKQDKQPQARSSQRLVRLSDAKRRTHAGLRPTSSHMVLAEWSVSPIEACPNTTVDVTLVGR